VGRLDAYSHRTLPNGDLATDYVTCDANPPTLGFEFYTALDEMRRDEILYTRTSAKLPATLAKVQALENRNPAS
jgi:hypothetical protein